MNPTILHQIDPRRLYKFFAEFGDDFAAAGLPLPPFDPDSDNPNYASSISAILASPALPERPRQTIEHLEFLAEPKNIDRLDAEVARLIPSLGFNPADHPIDRALNLWFHSQQATHDLAASMSDCRSRRKEALTSVPGPSPAASLPDWSSRREDGLTSEEGQGQVGGRAYPRAASPVEQTSSQAETPDQISLPQPVFRRLTDPDILTRMSTHYLHQLFERFKPELNARNIPLPIRLGEHDAISAAYIRLLSTPAQLPEPLVNALVAIAEFSAPENQRLLEKLAASADLDSSHEPESWAIRLWLRAPFDLQYIRTLKAHLPPDFFKEDVDYDDPDDDEPNAAQPPSTAAAALAQPLAGDQAGLAAGAEINPAPRNKIARLPKPVRESINQMLGQGLTYAEILQHLGETGKSLNKSNLWRWKKGPYQLWLKHQQRLEEAGGQLKFALEAVRQNQNNQIHEATQQIAALRISELFTQFDLPTLKAAVSEDPATLVRLANLLPKLSHAGLECERQRLELEERQAALRKSKTPKKLGISRKALRHVENRLKLM